MLYNGILTALACFYNLSIFPFCFVKEGIELHKFSSQHLFGIIVCKEIKSSMINIRQHCIISLMRIDKEVIFIINMYYLSINIIEKAFDIIACKFYNVIHHIHTTISTSITFN